MQLGFDKQSNWHSSSQSQPYSTWLAPMWQLRSAARFRTTGGLHSRPYNSTGTPAWESFVRVAVIALTMPSHCARSETGSSVNNRSPGTSDVEMPDTRAAGTANAAASSATSSPC